ncbi:ATP-dependent helicase [Alicyclobacillus suci]|uniref:ATP-dependent helicase n=1 Tax=Alicyclobacillus suci TaxID=2816080 RepID=UPI001A8E7573|nr:ATP-dependent helicase [Alicyclobacillus suci]
MPKLEDLNDAQREAATQIDGPVVVVAGAGSGKTSMLVTRVSELMKARIPANRILCCTFTKKATQEMRERIERDIGEQAKPVVVSTIHGLANKMVMPMLRDWKLVTRNEWIFEIILGNKTAVNRFGTGLSKEIELETAQLEVAKAKNSKLRPSDCRDPMIGMIYASYEKFKQSRKMLDFDDLLIKANEFMVKDEQFARRFQSRFTHIMVDEFQDVNLLQWDLIQKLSLPERNLFVVGDDFQSIYGFRGARPELILEFVRYYPDAKTIILERNYRSKEPVIHASNKVIALNTRQVKKRIIATRRGGDPVRTLNAYDEFDQASRVVETIASLRVAFPELKWSDFAVLFRTNQEAMSFEEIMVERDVPYNISDSTHFYENTRIKPIISYMKVVDALTRDELPEMDDLILTMKYPKGYIRKSSVERVQIEGMAVLEDTTNQDFDQYMTNLTKLLGATDPTSFIQILGDIHSDLLRVKEGETWLNALRRVLSKHQTLSSFLKHVDYSIEQSKEPKDDAVRLISIHGSKGLEFRTVFIANVVEGHIPYQRSVDEGHLDEETRLFYVAMTRAMDRLYLCVPKIIGEQPVVPSRYLDELRGGKKNE